MTIGVALLLIAAGAILRFAVNTVSTHGINVHTIGDILMIVGIIGLLLWLFVWGPWARGRRSRTTEDRTYAAGRQAARDPYRGTPAQHDPQRGIPASDPYREQPTERDVYPPGDRTYQDPYSR